jgi:hypothetical protein
VISERLKTEGSTRLTYTCGVRDSTRDRAVTTRAVVRSIHHCQPHDHTCGLVLNLVPGIVSGTKLELTCTTGITHFPSTRCSQITLNRQQSPERQMSLSTRILQKNSKCATCASLTTTATSTVRRHEKDNQR